MLAEADTAGTLGPGAYAAASERARELIFASVAALAKHAALTRGRVRGGGAQHGAIGPAGLAWLYVQERCSEVEIPPGARSEQLEVTIAA